MMNLLTKQIQLHLCLEKNYSYIRIICSIKDRVHCISTRVVMIKCFFLNPEKKILCRSVLSFSRKMQKLLNSDTLHSQKNDVIEPNARRLLPAIITS